MGGAEFGMKLQPPHALTPAERMAGIVRIARQHGGARGRLQHALQVRGLRRETHRQASKQGVAVRLRVQINPHRAHFPPIRVIAYLPAQRMREQLVAVADAQQRQPCVCGLVQPRGACLLYTSRCV